MSILRFLKGRQRDKTDSGQLPDGLDTAITDQLGTNQLGTDQLGDGSQAEAPNASAVKSKSGEGSSRRLNLLAVLWQGLRHPWLLLVLGLLALLLILGALLFPQVPPEIFHDVPATTRWMMSTSSEYGTIGQLMLNMGLFDVLHSNLLRILFSLIGLVLAVHLGDVVGDLLHRLRVQRILGSQTKSIEEPLLSQTSSTIYQLRTASPTPLSQLRAKVDDHVGQSFKKIEHTQLEIPSPSVETEGTQKDGAEHSSGDPTEVPQERVLAHRGLLANYLRPLLMIGLLIALIPVWLITSTGWELYPPPLAPGEELSFESQGLDIRYLAQIDGDTGSSADISRALELQVGEEQLSLPLTPNAAGSIPLGTEATGSEATGDGSGDGNSNANNNGAVAENLSSTNSVGVRLNQVDIEASVGPPGLLISTVDGSDDLVLPDSSQRLPNVGLVFPGAGNEKAVILASQATALRIVRSDDEAQASYIIQLIDRSGNPLGEPQRVDGTQQTVFDTELAGKALRFDPIPGVVVEARYLPGLWLMFVALGLVLIGAIGYLLPSGYLLLQLAPWPSERTIAIAQSDSRSEIASIRKLLSTPPADKESSGVSA